MSDPEVAKASEETPASTEVQVVLPLEIIDRCVGQQIKVLLTHNKEFHGKLVGFDDFVNIVLENAYEIDGDGTKSAPIKKMLLNGGQIAMLIPAN